MPSYVINVMSVDHPGIVAGVSSAIGELGGNIASCSQTVLSGYFTLIIVVDLPQSYEIEALVAAIRRFETFDHDCQLMVRRADRKEPVKQEPAETFILTVFGIDRSGIIRELSNYLAGRDINISDLFGDKRGDDCLLVGQVEIPTDLDPRLIQDDLEEMGRAGGFTVKLQHHNIFAATNDLYFGARNIVES